MMVNLKRLSRCMERLCNNDLYPWYWLSYAEKGYGFATVAAFPKEMSDKYPEPGTELEYHEDGYWVGNNGTPMIIEEWITDKQSQLGDAMCEFVALAHAKLLAEDLRRAMDEHENDG